MSAFSLPRNGPGWATQKEVEMTPEEQAAADALAAEEAAAVEPQDDSKAELERMRAALKNANKEAADRRKRLEQLESAEVARQQAEMTELDRVKAEIAAADKRATDAEARARETIIRAAFVAEAAKAGATFPDDVYRLADRAAVDVDEDGTVTGVADAVKALLDAGRIPLSGRRKAPPVEGDQGNDGRRDDGEPLTQDQLRMAQAARMTPAQYAKRLKETETE